MFQNLALGLHFVFTITDRIFFSSSTGFPNLSNRLSSIISLVSRFSIVFLSDDFPFKKYLITGRSTAGINSFKISGLLSAMISTEKEYSLGIFGLSR